MAVQIRDELEGEKAKLGWRNGVPAIKHDKAVKFDPKSVSPPSNTYSRS